MGFWSGLYRHVSNVLDPDIVWAYGAANFPPTVGNPKMPGRGMAKALCSVVPKGTVIPIDEFGTTKMGFCCHEKLDIVMVSSCFS